MPREADFKNCAREDAGSLTSAEQDELTQFLDQLEASEAALLAPATQRLRQQREALQLVNADLKAVLARKEELVRRLEAVLGEATAERDAINEGINRVLRSARTETVNAR